MDCAISILDHFLNVAVVRDASSPVVALVHGLDDGLVLLEKGVGEQVQQFHALQRHLHHHLHLHPKTAHLLTSLLACALLSHQDPSKHQTADLPRESTLFLLVLTLL